MKNTASKLILAASICALVVAFAAPPLRAADEKKQPPLDPEAKKYDRNANGKLDPDEEAAMKADQAKARAEKEREKKKEAERKK
jgi:hypothetical protein